VGIAAMPFATVAALTSSGNLRLRTAKKRRVFYDLPSPAEFSGLSDQIEEGMFLVLTNSLEQQEVPMSEEDLELLITLDDPGEDALEEDTFNHLQAENTGQPFPTRRRHDQPTDVILDNDRSKLAG
jgi:hypothetical protein